MCSRTAGIARTTRHRGGEHAPRHRPAQHGAHDRAPEARLAVTRDQPPQERDAPAVDPVAELRDHRGQDRERADERDRHDQDRADAEALKHARAHQQHARHRGHHRQARHQHRAPGRGRRDLERRRGRAALRPLLAVAAQVEQRVVHADGQADEQDHGVDRLVDVHEVAEQRGQPERSHHRGHAEQQRDAGGDQRAEGEHEDDERHGERGDLGLLEVLGEAVAHGLGDAGVADLADQQVRVGLLHRCRRGQRGVDAVRRGVGIARDLERQQRGAAVGRQLAAVARVQRRLDRRHRPHMRQARAQIVDRRPQLGASGDGRCGSGSAPPRRRARSGTRAPAPSRRRSNRRCRPRRPSGRRRLPRSRSRTRRARTRASRGRPSFGGGRSTGRPARSR